MGTVAMERFHTTASGTRDPLGYWNELCSNTITRVRIDSRHREHFAGEVRRLALGTTTLYSAASLGAVVQHRREDIRRYSSRVFKLMLMDEGSSLARVNDQEFHLSAGDITLVDSARPWSLSFDAPVRVVMLQVPADLLLDRGRAIEDAVGTHLRAGLARTAVLSSFLRTVNTTSSEGVHAGWAAALDSAAVDLAGGMLWADERVDDPVHDRTLTRACRLIRERYSDPQLDVATIAEGIGVSVRAVQLAFARTGTTPTAFLRERRLKRAAKLLAQGSRVTDAAFDAGFTDLSSFGRAFREHHGVTPTAWRAGARSLS